MFDSNNAPSLPSIVFRTWHSTGKHSTAELHCQNSFPIILFILIFVWMPLTYLWHGVCVGQKTAFRSWSWPYTLVSGNATPVLKLLEMCFKLTSLAAPFSELQSSYFATDCPGTCDTPALVCLWNEITDLAMNKWNGINSWLCSIQLFSDFWQ